jgi:osmoprotectant transport system ATP-binding protein
VDYDDLPRLRRQIGYAVQGTGLFPHMTIRENIDLCARLANWDPDRLQERLTQLREMVQLDADLMPRYPHELSGGQQQRAGLARAMLLNPPLVLLDEPFAALDPLTRMDVHAQLLALQALEPRCILLVTHDMREALKLADRVVVLEGGRIVEDSESAALAARYPDMEAEQLLLTLLGESV